MGDIGFLGRSKELPDFFRIDVSVIIYITLAFSRWNFPTIGLTSLCYKKVYKPSLFFI